jgi:hypothetical protein
MPIFITDEATDLATLVTNLAGGARVSGATLELVKALNPQLSDTTKLGAGTVLILPETPELKARAGEPAGAESLETLGSRLHTGLRDVESRTMRGFEALVADHGAVRNALKAAAAKRLVEGDPQLKKQLAAAEAHFEAEQKRVAETRKQLVEAAKTVEAEFARLQNLLG